MMNQQIGPSSSRILTFCVVVILVLGARSVSAVDLFRIDFEDFGRGNLVDAQPPQSEMFRWTAPKAGATISTNVVHGGKQALKLGANRSLAVRRFDGGDGIHRLSSMNQYFDYWVYPDTEISDYIVVARLTDPAGPAFADVHFASEGNIKILTRENGQSIMTETGGPWKVRAWNRVTIKLDVAAQTIAVWLNGEPCTSKPLPLPARFSGTLSHVTLEGPHAEHASFAVYYDDLQWSDVDSIAAK